MLRAGVPVLCRRDGAVQLGWSPEDSTLLEPATDAVLGLLRALRTGLRPEDVAATARQVGMTPDAAQALLTDLKQAGLAVLTPDVHARPPAVRLIGSGPLTDALWQSLRRHGHPTTRSRTAAPSATGLRDRRPHLVVPTDTLIVDPALVDRLHEARAPHLPVRIRDGRGVVGPLVVPGRTSCLRCADLFRCDRDPEWPYLAAQLLGAVGHADPDSVAVTAGLALNQITAACDALFRPARRRDCALATVNATVELDLHELRIDRRPWPQHPRCTCRLGGSTATL